MHAAAVLAEHEGDESWVPAGELAAQEGIPRKFLEAILVDLRNAGLAGAYRC